MNIAYIDNQNLYMATTHAPEPWSVDMRRFRVYLREKYGVEEAYLFMGAFSDESQSVYNLFQRFGYILVWRPHGCEFAGNKKGNVDTDIVFSMMRDLYERNEIEEMYLISGDGDYFRTVEHVREKGKLGKVMLPSHNNASSLYRSLPGRHKVFLDSEGMEKKIRRKK